MEAPPIERRIFSGAAMASFGQTKGRASPKAIKTAEISMKRPKKVLMRKVEELLRSTKFNS